MPKDEAAIALAVIKAGVSAVPVVGGAVASLLGDYMAASTQESLEKGFSHLSARLREIEGRIDTENLNKEEFSELFKTTYLVMVRSHKEERLVFAANLLANILLKEGDDERLSYTELDHFARCLESLSIGALHCLSKIYVDEKNVRVSIGPKQTQIQVSALSKQLPDYDPDLLMGLLGELNAQNLIHMTGAPAVRTENYGNYPILPTSMGERFVAHVMRISFDR